MKGTVSAGALAIVANNVSTATEALSATEDAGLSNKVTFLVFGRPLLKAAEDFPNLSLDKYFDATRAFPSMSSCVKGGKDAMRSDGLNVNWALVSKLEELDVCIFNAAKYLSDPSLFKNWLVQQGFDDVAMHSVDRGSMKLYGVYSEGWSIDGTMLRNKFPSDFESWWHRFGADAISAGVVLDQSFAPVRASSIFLKEKKMRGRPNGNS